ncbi:BANP isoform 24, partial [Pongo abelii]
MRSLPVRSHEAEGRAVCCTQGIPPPQPLSSWDYPVVLENHVVTDEDEPALKRQRLE